MLLPGYDPGTGPGPGLMSGPGSDVYGIPCWSDPGSGLRYVWSRLTVWLRLTVSGCMISAPAYGYVLSSRLRLRACVYACV